MILVADEHAGFMEAICANHEDDSVRLIYADWLDEHGDADRAEFIRLQVCIARGGNGDEKYTEMRLRSGDLLTKNFGLRWAMPILDLLGWSNSGARVGSWGWRRGFIESVTLTAKEWFLRHDELTSLTPIREVTLTTVLEVSARLGTPDNYIVTLADLPGGVGVGPRGDERGATLDRLGARWPRIRFTIDPVYYGGHGTVHVGDTTLSFDSWSLQPHVTPEEPMGVIEWTESPPAARESGRRCPNCRRENDTRMHLCRMCRSEQRRESRRRR